MLLDLRKRVDEPEVRELLSYAVGPTTLQIMNQIAQKYREDTDLALWGMEADQTIIGCIGVHFKSPAKVVINHISVHPDYRHRHIASKMIDHLIQTSSVKIVSAETDMDAVAFYRRYGFSIISLGEKYPGVERFLCVYRTETYNKSYC